MKKIELFECGEGELSLFIDNDEGLYNLDQEGVIDEDTLKEIFVFTEEQHDYYLNNRGE